MTRAMPIYEETPPLLCPDCGSELEDAGCYKLGCPNGCLEAMECWQWEEYEKEKA